MQGIDRLTIAIPPTTRRPRAPVERVLAEFSPGTKVADEVDDGAPVPLAEAVPTAGVVLLPMGYDGVAAVAEATSAKAVAMMVVNCMVAVGDVVVVLSIKCA